MHKCCPLYNNNYIYVAVVYVQHIVCVSAAYKYLLLIPFIYQHLPFFALFLFQLKFLLLKLQMGHWCMIELLVNVMINYS